VIDALRNNIEALAHGRKLDGRTDCPKCGGSMSVPFRTNGKGRVYWFACGTAACLRFYAPELIHPRKRRGIVYPQRTLGL